MSGPVLTLLLILVIELLPGPERMPLLPILMFAIAYTVLAGGLWPGIASGIISVIYALFSFERTASRGDPAENLESLVIFTLATPIAVATLGKLRQRLDGLLARERRFRGQAEIERERVVKTLESITDGFFALDREWRYTYVNREAERLVGRSRDALLGHSVWEAFPPLVGSIWDREYHRAVQQQIAVHFEGFYPPLDMWFETHAYPSSEGLTIYLHSIDERKRAEQELRARAQQQAAVATLGQQALLGDDIQHLMDTAVRLLASTLEVDLAKVLELLPGGQELAMRAGVGWSGGLAHRVAAGERSQAGYTLLSHGPVVVEDLPNEERFQGPRLLLDHGVVSGMSVIIGDGERPFGILGAHTRQPRTFTRDDVNFLQAVANVLAEAIARHRDQMALADSEERFRQLADHVHEVFYIVAIDPIEVLYVNPAFESVWGRPCASLYAEPASWEQAVHPADRAAVGGFSDARRDAFDGEYRIVRPDGTVRWIHDRSSRIHDRNGRPYRLVGIAEDVTALREAAESARRLAASEAAVKARDEVLAVVAHDLRNPLNTIALSAAFLETHEPRPDVRTRYARMIARASATAEHLIRDLLDVARIEAAQLAIEARPLEVGPPVAEACEMVRPRAAERSVALDVDLAADAPLVVGDRDRILQVLDNLLTNAIKFTPPGGRVRVGVARCPEGVEFTVADTGRGIAPDALPHVFDRFWRGRPGDLQGCGLGLAIVRGIVSAHRGRVWAESELGAGSVFHFTLPAIDSSAQARSELLAREH